MLDFIQQQGALFIAGVSVVFVAVLWLCNRVQRSMPSPVNRLIVRWFRFLLIGLYASIVFKMTLFAGAPFWRLFSMGLLAWMLIDSGYLWLYILAWDKSELPLFPAIREVDKIDWPANTRFFLIKDWIREQQYKEIGSFHYLYEDEVLQQLIVYESPDKTVRLQVIIVTDVTGVIMDQVVFASETEDGSIVVTDNVFMPYGGVYPEHWIVNRYPPIRKIESIAKYHKKAISRTGDSQCVVFEDDAKLWIEEMQQDLEIENVKAGILNHRRDRNEFGKMTGEGRYRIWKELLLLNYFSVSVVGKK